MEETKMIVNGKRPDGRKLNDFREMELQVGMLKRADGSGFFRFGKTQAIAAVHGPRNVHPRHMQNSQRAIIRTRYNMAPFSTEDRVRPGPSRRSTEISKVTNEALSSVMFFEDYPKTAIDVFIEILQADASTRCAGINAASLALADAGIPMKDIVCSCSAGKVDGQVVLDVGGKEDMEGEVDIAMAVIPDGKFVLLQLDGIITKEEFLKALEMGKEGCKQIYKKIKETLLNKYSRGNENDVEG